MRWTSAIEVGQVAAFQRAEELSQSGDVLQKPNHQSIETTILNYIITFIFILKQQMKHKAMTHYEFILGPVKIKDGLFMGDQLAAKDIQFVISNKVTHVINTVSKQIPNLWQRFGIQYLSVNWTQKQQNIFDKKNNAINAIYHFIEQAMEQGQSCLVHSVNGKSRACTVIVAYMMKKYNWGLDKCLEFINTKKQHLQIRNGFLVQLQQLEKRLSQIYNLSLSWQQNNNEQQLVMKNTFINSKPSHANQKPPIKSTNKKVSFIDKDKAYNNKNNNNNVISLSHKPKQKQSGIKLKSILKGDKDEDDPNSNQYQQEEEIKKLKQSNFISNINGSIVHVTVNNFITTEKKPQNTNKTTANSRPYSSDTKQREKKTQTTKIGRMFAFDNIGEKSPYEAKLITKIGSNNKLSKKKQQQTRNPPILMNERPQSANIAAQRRKVKNGEKIMIQNTLKKQEMVVMGKKRYPSTNPKEQLYKFK